MPYTPFSRLSTIVAALVLCSMLVFQTGCDSADVDDLSGPADITGLILDSQAGAPIEGATVTFRRGNGQRSATTDETGTYTINGIATGTFSILIRAAGYIDVTIDEVVIRDGQNNLNPYVAPQAPPAGAYRIVLTWGEQPRDLDSHLTGPTAGGTRFHVWYADRQPVNFADLDRDDTSSFGPETITVRPEVNGTYRYSVFNFSNQGATGSQGIAGEIPNSARARVQVYSSTALVREYLAPPSTAGNTWRVFEMNAQGGNISLTDINTYHTASGSSDMTTFRPIPKEAPGILEAQN